MDKLTLKKIAQPLNRKGPVLNIILDGLAISPHHCGNAFYQARTPCLDNLMKTCLYRQLYAHGHHVGMPGETDMGNSEVGHNAIGAGRIFDQGAKIVQNAIIDRSLYTYSAWNEIIDLLKNPSRALHLLGLLSDGNVHAHISHLEALVSQAAAAGAMKIYLHLLTDGRDMPPTSSLKLLARLENHLSALKTQKPGLDCRIVSVAGRMTAFMDRYEANWDLVERGWNLVVAGIGPQFPSAEAGIRASHRKNPNDQFVTPFLVAAEGLEQSNAKKSITICDEDVVICFNFRGDRAIELSRAFDGDVPFTKKPDIKVHYFGMTLYDGDTQTPQKYLVPPPLIDRTMGEYLVANKIPLFALSETQKYGHVTYFWNGNRSQPFDRNLETYLEIKSNDRPFEEVPWMKAAEITDQAIKCLHSQKYQFARINYPNGDMVGHTGHFQACIIAVEAVDLALSRLLDVVKSVEGIAIVTADHGNCDQMYELDPTTGAILRDEADRPLLKTSHTLNPVPCIFYDPAYQGEYELRSDNAVHNAGIAHLAATTLMLLGFEPPHDYLPSLIKWRS
ncbi:2%2C3-bisphosphoglycerate-independent phosphoglycerate mutase [Spirochaetota bacterium]|nr:2%2C3-bisphosphoglycerate-independent phosphoglycerate mutase [Spirochaetota bacterium]